MSKGERTIYSLFKHVLLIMLLPDRKHRTMYIFFSVIKWMQSKYSLNAKIIDMNTLIFRLPYALSYFQLSFILYALFLFRNEFRKLFKL